ncbi:ABC transporter permease [Pokkaliibacter sp. MBI-7]|uniref:ABC transporter permease n=1 Tax=Pokkaliibacter sp. MBI-7 TaxID=3040600 RepID=UPI00244CFB56|nr:ABC transporter permease [Pokkaliibacter sp. MBI-7]MDH2435999.1 ABC transporter permease [Pokkaliibacter sp. MBI-7]
MSQSLLTTGGQPASRAAPSARPRRHYGQWLAHWALAPALAFFLAFWLLPFVQLMVMGAGADSGSGEPGYWAVLTHRQYLFSLLVTVLLSLAVAVLAVVIAAICGCFLARNHFFGRSLLLSMLTFPLAFPGVVVGFLVIMLGGRQGLSAQLGQLLAGERWTFAYSLTGLFIGYLYFSIPRVIMTVMAACEKLDTSLEEAARSLGANSWRVIADVLIPGIRPALISTGAICFATSMGAFGTAFTLGTRINVVPMAIYGEFTNYANFAMSAALSVLLGAVTWLALALARRLSADASLGGA